MEGAGIVRPERAGVTGSNGGRLRRCRAAAPGTPSVSLGPPSSRPLLLPPLPAVDPRLGLASPAPAASPFRFVETRRRRSPTRMMNIPPTNPTAQLVMASASMASGAHTTSPSTTTSKKNWPVPPVPLVELRCQRTNPVNKPRASPPPTIRRVACKSQRRAKTLERVGGGKSDECCRPDVGSSHWVGGQVLMPQR